MVELEKLLEEAKAWVEHLRQHLPSQVDPVGLSRVKLAFGPLACREAVIWRLVELGDSACQCYEQERIASGILLTRAVTECAAIVWYLMEAVRDFIPENFENTNEKIEKLWLGSKDNPAMPNAINVLTMLQRADKSCPGILHSYNSLSEYSHPNWAAQTLHRKIDYETKYIDFGHYPRDASKIGLNCLTGSLGVFEHAYNKISDLMPRFIKNCEIAIPENPK